MSSVPSGKRFIIILYYIFLAAGIYLILKLGKDGSFLSLTANRSQFMDFLMTYWTYLGTGIFSIFITVLLLFKKIRTGLYIISTYIISGLIVQIFKKVIYTDRPRPYKYFGDLDIVIPSVPGIEMHSYNSFPSGHSATAFALFFSLIFITQNKFLVFIFFILAIGVAYSRIYLAQHFPVDVLGGSIIGVITAFSVYPLIYNRNNDWIDKDLLSLIGKR